MGGVFELLVRAVEERRAVRFTYAGDPPGATRLVHPHVLFRSPSGKHCIDAVQVGGHRGRLMPLPAWRVFALDRIDELHLLDDRFAPHPDVAAHRHDGTVAVCGGSSRVLGHEVRPASRSRVQPGHAPSEHQGREDLPGPPP